jgi:hypothetical protein
VASYLRFNSKALGLLDQGKGGPVTMNTPDYTISEARYAKGKMAIRSEDGSGYKTSAAHLIEALGGRWVNRGSAYVCSSATARDFEALIMAGWHGRASWFRGEPSWFSHPIYGDKSRREAVALARKATA